MLYYMTLHVLNKAQGNVLLLSSDNHPPEGLIIKPNAQMEAVVPKELETPADIVFHAVDPATEEPMLINGKSSFKVTPKKEKEAATQIIISGGTRGEVVEPIEPGEQHLIILIVITTTTTTIIIIIIIIIARSFFISFLLL